MLHSEREAKRFFVERILARARIGQMERAAALECYEKLVATNPRVERKGATMPYTSLNGHMFSVMRKDGTLALRLPTEARRAFLKKYKTTLSEQYGSVQPDSSRSRRRGRRHVEND